MQNDPLDDRAAVYQCLHHNELCEQEEANRHSAQVILSQVFRLFSPQSVLDVGCGLGTWLAVARQLGAADIRGIEGAWLDRRLVRVPERLIVTLDLEQAFDLGQRFDLVICLEVAEHLSSAAARQFIESLVRHADVILFSAAIPFQGGHHHVNEEFPDYWAELFHRLGYRPVDFIRPLIWADPSVLWWLRQNTLLFVRQELTTGDLPFANLAERSGPLSIVHPEIYLARMRSEQAVRAEYSRLLAILSSGNTFSVVRQANGQLAISRLS